MDTGIQRLSPEDLTVLATDAGQVPMNMAAVLEFGPVSDVAALVATLGERLSRVPRLRQRLQRPGWGGGRPFWVDDEAFDLARHVQESSLPAGDLVCRRLCAKHPLWRMYYSDSGGDVRVVIVLHHVLADGMGGLAALAALVDGVPVTAPRAPCPVPTRQEVRRDAAAHRRAARRNAGAGMRRLVAGMREMGLGSSRPALVARSSILRPTSTRRRVLTLEAPLAEVVDAGHRQAATVNDLVLAAVAGTLEGLLDRRGEHPAQLVISVPVSGRTRAGELGNQVGAVPVAVPTGCSRQERLRHIVASTARAKGQQRGSSAQVLGVVFRGLAAVGVGQYFVDHQRLVHSFETNLRGPNQPLWMGGQRLRRIVPIAVNPGNVGVSFDVLSYAGTLVISIVACPRTVPEMEVVADLLAAELAALLA